MTDTRIPPAWPRKSDERIPPTNDPARPSPIVAKIPIGAGPGSASRASAPTIRPSRASTRMNHSTMRGLFLGAQALEQTCPRGGVLVVLENACVVELLEQTQIVRRVLRGSLSRVRTVSRRRRLQRRSLLEHAELLGPDLVGIDPGPLEPLAILLDADAALGEAIRVPPPERPLLDEMAVGDHQPDRRKEARDAHPRSVLGVPAFYREHYHRADRRAEEPDHHRQPGRHRVGARNCEARKCPRDEG